MHKFLFTALATLSLTSLAQNPLPSAKASKDAAALARAVYSPETHTKQIEAAVSATTAQLSGMKNIAVDTDKLRAAFAEILNYQEMLDLQASLLAKYYTVDEMAALAKFYSSALGKKSLNVLPQVTQDIMGMMMQKMSSPETQKILDRAVTKSTPATGKDNPAE